MPCSSGIKTQMSKVCSLAAGSQHTEISSAREVDVGLLGSCSSRDCDHRLVFVAR